MKNAHWEVLTSWLEEPEAQNFVDGLKTQPQFKRIDFRAERHVKEDDQCKWWHIEVWTGDASPTQMHQIRGFVMGWKSRETEEKSNG